MAETLLFRAFALSGERDGLLDTEEEAIGTHALRSGTDGDGFDDGEEVLVLGTDPLDPLDPAPTRVRERRGKGKRRR